MKRTDAPGATADHKFQDGNPFDGTPSTVVDETVLNAHQEEIAHVVEASGSPLDPTDDSQLLKAIQSLQGLTPAQKAAFFAQAFETPHLPFIPGQRLPRILVAASSAQPNDATEEVFGLWIAGNTGLAPTNAIALGGGDYDQSGTLTPGHCWPYTSFGGAVTKHTSNAYYWPACPPGWAYNGYREGVSIEPGMLGSRGGRLEIVISGLIKSTNSPSQMLEVVLHPNLVTSVDGGGANTTAFTANLKCAFRFEALPLTNNYPATIRITGEALSAYVIQWTATLVIGTTTYTATEASVEITRMTRLLRRNYVSAPINWDTDYVKLAVLLKADATSATAYTIGSATSAQDGTVVRFAAQHFSAVLFPGA